MVESKTFLANPKQQDHISQFGENDCSANNKKNGHYYEYPRLFHSWVNVSYKENGGNKGFYCKSKA